MKLQIELPDALIDSLLEACLDCSTVEDPVTPEQFASECVESVLASRRLEAMCQS